MVFEAQVTTTSGYLFQHSLAAPAGLKIEDVSLLEDDVERASRWSQEADGRLTVFLNDAASGSPAIAASRTNADPGGKGLAAAARSPGAVSASLGDDSTAPASAACCLTIQGSRQPAAAEPPGERAKSDAEYFVEAMSWDGLRVLPVTVTVTPNRPKVRVQEIVTAQWNRRSWTARLDGRLSIRGGVVDRFEIRAPPPWNGPYRASLPGPASGSPVARPSSAVGVPAAGSRFR